MQYNYVAFCRVTYHSGPHAGRQDFIFLVEVHLNEAEPKLYEGGRGDVDHRSPPSASYRIRLQQVLGQQLLVRYAQVPKIRLWFYGSSMN